MKTIQKLSTKILEGALSFTLIPAYGEIPSSVTEDVLQFTRGDSHFSVLVEVPTDLIEAFIEAPDIQRRELSDLIFKRYNI